MSRTVTINSVDRTSAIRLDSLVTVEAAFGGEVGVGGFNLDDEALGDVAAMKDITIIESAASPTRAFTGFIAGRSLGRGELGKVANRRQWDVEVVDINACLDDEVFTSSAANRSSETDYARMSWLLDSPAVLQSLGVTAGVLPNTNTVTMDAFDYRGSTPRRVADDCAEAAGKNYFIYNFGSGHKLYYDKQTGTGLTSSVNLSSVATEVDNATTWAIEEPSLRKDPTRIYSTVMFKYEGGQVTVTNGTTESTYRRREIFVEDSTVKSASLATAKATAYLAASASEEETLTCAVTLPAAKLNDIRAGQRIPVKVPHLGIGSNTYYRATRRTVTAAPGKQGVSDVLYKVALEFAPEIKMTGFAGGGKDPSACFDVTETDDGLPTCNTNSDSEVFNFGVVGPVDAHAIILWAAYIDVDTTITISWTVGGTVYKSVDAVYPWHKAWATVRCYQNPIWTDPDVEPEPDACPLITAAGDFVDTIIQVGGSWNQTEGPLLGWRPSTTAGSPQSYDLTAGMWAVIYVNCYRECINVGHADYSQSPWPAPAGIDGWQPTITLDSGSYTCRDADLDVIGQVCQGKMYGPVTLYDVGGNYSFPYPFTPGTLTVWVGGTVQIPFMVLGDPYYAFTLADDPGSMLVQASAQIPIDFQL